MDYALKAALTASLITTLVLLAKWLGEYAAGLLSGLPFTALPTLLLIGLERGAAAATEAAVGGITGCALASLFALVYHATSRRLSPLPALAISIGCLAAGLLLASRWMLSLPVAGVLACGAAACALCLIRAMPVLSAEPILPPQTRSRAAVSALSVGALGAGVTMLVIALRPSLAGIVASMPIIGVATAATTHATRGRAAVPRFLRGYVVSSLAKTGFCVVFALCAITLGIGLALVAACFSCGLVCCLARESRPAPLLPDVGANTARASTSGISPSTSCT